jgi:hypothetical protein
MRLAGDHVREEAGTQRYNVGTDTPKLCATSCGSLPLANQHSGTPALQSSTIARSHDRPLFTSYARLPKTRDLSTLEDPVALEAIKELLEVTQKAT